MEQIQKCGSCAHFGACDFILKRYAGLSGINKDGPGCSNYTRTMKDILGDDYYIERLRELVEAYREGRCVVLPVPLHSVLLDMSDTCRPDVLKDFRISATWTHNGIVFYCPWNIFNQNIEKGYIRLMSESATAVLEGEQNG